MNKLKELRKKVRKNNKGFSLVELIVVIVILAILIGVTIGGIYQYVNQSRVNTDINNAASIQSVLATVATDADVNKAFKSAAGAASVKITWNEAKTTYDADAGSDAKAGPKVVEKVKARLTDGLPAPKAGGTFQIVISKDADGNITATCKAYDQADAKGSVLVSEKSTTNAPAEEH